MIRRIATAPSETETLLVVTNDNWGATSLTAVFAVLKSAFDVLTDAFGTPPDAPIRVARWDQGPRTLYDRRPYEICLSARDRYWCQYVYQFSHELCHVMTGFDRYRDHKHKWFEETLCELASLFVLRRLAKVWEDTPPADIIGAKEFAPNHRTYAKHIQNKYGGVLDSQPQDWLAMNIKLMEDDPCKRDLNGVVAVSLLGRFSDDPSLWRDCESLNQWNPGVDATFADYLDSWAGCLLRKGHTGRVPTIVRTTLQLRSAGPLASGMPASPTQPVP